MDLLCLSAYLSIIPSCNKKSTNNLVTRNLPVSFNGYRVAFISDIHIGSMWNAEHELETLSDILSSTDADLVLFGGDLVNLHFTELTPQILNILSKIKGIDGVFAVMGNHDTGSYVKGSTKDFRAENMASLAVNAATAGWVFLRDSTAYTPASLMYDEWSGLYEKGKDKLYINDGIGSVAFIARFGARPEITVIILYRE